jgi:hypothetical protein
MIISVVVILFVGLITYIHYVQGLMNGIISAVLAVTAAMLALSFYESAATSMSGGKYADESHGIMLIVIFAGVYIVGRVIFDKAIPGNIRMPHIADGIGGAIGGLVAGIFGVGIVMIAFQSMPFGPSIGGYSRYELVEHRDVTISPEGQRQVNRVVYDEMKGKELSKEQQGLILPVDDIVLGFAKRLSNGGALAGERPFESVHPDLLQEMFGQRMGIEVAAKHTAFSKGGQAADVKQATFLAQQTLPKTATEIKGIRDPLPPNDKLTPAPGKVLVAITVMFKLDATDTDKKVRLGTGSVRLVTKDPQGEGWTNTYALGTVQPIGNTWYAWVNRPDDFLFIDAGSGDHGAHFLFEVDMQAFEPAPDAKPLAPATPGGKAAGADAYVFKPGSFLEVKRLTMISLDKTRVTVGMPPTGAQYYPIRKKALLNEEPTAGTGGAAAAPTPPTPAPTPEASTPGEPTDANGWKSAPLGPPLQVLVGNKLPFPIGVGTNDADGDVATLAVSAHLTGKKFDAIETDVTAADAAPDAIAKAVPTLQELFVPPGKRMVQVQFKNIGSDPWLWMNWLSRFQVYSPVTRSHYGVYGAYGTLKNPQGAERVFLLYKASAPLTPFRQPQGTLENVSLIFIMPAEEKATEVRIEGRSNGLAVEK